MSQEKVERNKEIKKNRKKLVKKERRNRIFAGIIAIAIVCAAGVWIGYSIYGTVKESREEAAANEKKVTTPIDLSALTSYTAGVRESGSTESDN